MCSGQLGIQGVQDDSHSFVDRSPVSLRFVEAGGLCDRSWLVILLGIERGILFQMTW